MQNNQLKQDYLLNDRYRIYNCLGQGGFGITYRAKDEVMGQVVAIKEYFPRMISSRDDQDCISVFPNPGDRDIYQEGLKRFLEEARRLASLFEIPGVVKVLNYFEENQTAYLVMEYIKGESLRSYLSRQEKDFSFEETCQMMLPVMTVLEKIHKRHLIHRDITPDNLMVDETGSIKLLDFGSTREYFAEQNQNKTMTVLVKSGYAPPEQYDRHGKQGPWTDIYSLCATMYEIMTGCTPQNAKERQISDNLHPLSAFNVKITPEQEESFLKKGLALNPKDRFQTVHKMCIDFFPEKKKKQEEKKEAGKRSLILAAFLALFAAGVFGIVRYHQIRSVDQPIQLAGNYVRGSEKYIKYLDFIKEHALEIQTEGDTTTYTLDKSAVLEWGESANYYTMDCTKDEFLDNLREIGYEPEFSRSGDSLYVKEMPYGAITTNFEQYDIYMLPGDVELQIGYDLISNQITRIYVIAAPELSDTTMVYAVEILSLLADDMEGDPEENIRELKDKAASWYQSQLESFGGTLIRYTFRDISAYLSLSADMTKLGMHITSAGADRLRDDIPPYYWP